MHKTFGAVDGHRLTFKLNNRMYRTER